MSRSRPLTLITLELFVSWTIDVCGIEFGRCFCWNVHRCMNRFRFSPSEFKLQSWMNELITQFFLAKPIMRRIRPIGIFQTGYHARNTHAHIHAHTCEILPATSHRLSVRLIHNSPCLVDLKWWLADWLPDWSAGWLWVAGWLAVRSCRERRLQLRRRCADVLSAISADSQRMDGYFKG